MKPKIEPISHETHKDLRVKVDYRFDHVRDSQFIALNANEFAYASTCYPIFFIKDRTTAKFFPVALFGIEKDENLFYSEQHWQAYYIPKLMSLAPFSMAPIKTADGEEKWAVCIDRNNKCLCSDEGERLYEDGGTNNQIKETAFLEQARNTLAALYQEKSASLAFIDRLLELNLIKAVQFNLGYEDGEKRVVEGLYSIDAEGAKNLTQEQILEFHERGYFPSIYAMQNSQHNLYDLIKKRRDKGGRKIKLLQVVDAVKDG